MTVMAFGVAAEEATNLYEVTNVEGKGTLSVITLEDTQAFCVQRKVAHPTVGIKYTTTDHKVNGIENLFCAMYELNDNSYDFRAASQIATWAYTENISLANWIKLYVGTEEAMTHYNNILETAKNIDVSKYDVNVEFVASEGYQILAIPTVTKKVVMMAPPPVIPEPTPEPEPVPEVEEEVEEIVEPVPPVEEIEEVVEETDPEPVPVVEEEPEVEPVPEILADEPYYPEAPKTGDTSNLTLWIILCVTSLACVFVLFAVNRKKHIKEN